MKTLYDSDNYYDGDGQATRLAPSLSSLLYLLDWAKAWGFARKSKLYQTNRSGSSEGKPRVLDIGAGDGKFLYFMRRFGRIPSGTTLSSVSQQTAKSVFGIDLELTKTISPKLQKHKYQAITYWHVFEHLDDPESHVSAWPSLLTSDGVVMVEVPNIESIGARLSFDAWLGSDLKHHINHMTAKQIVELIEKYGMSVDRKETFSLKFTYPFIWSGLLGRLFGTRLYHFDSVFGALKDPLGRLRKSPFVTLNTIASIYYLAPVILVLAVSGVITGRGEVLRLYVSRSKGAVHGE